MEWGLADLAETAELLASELITNAVQASERLRIRADLAMVPVVQLWLTSDRISLAIHVWDGSDEMPVRKDASPDVDNGRGLMLVESLSSDCGAYRRETGKGVYCVITRENSAVVRIEDPPHPWPIKDRPMQGG